jgi:hypothetical protein
MRYNDEADPVHYWREVSQCQRNEAQDAHVCFP